MDGTLVGMIVGQCVVLVLVSAALYVLARRIHVLPRFMWSLTRNERTEAQRQAEALALLHAAAQEQVSRLVGGIQSLHNQLASELRTESADAELRARLLERHAKDTGAAVDEAQALVNTLREMIDNAGTSARARRAELEPRRIPPGPEPPRSGPILPPEPANVAAGSTRPRALPRRTLLGILPPASPPPAAEEGDRPSEDDLTQVVDRPKPEQLGTAKTLVSMQATVLPKEREGSS